jgi:hypothetical protein
MNPTIFELRDRLDSALNEFSADGCAESFFHEVRDVLEQMLEPERDA